MDKIHYKCIGSSGRGILSVVNASKNGRKYRHMSHHKYYLEGCYKDSMMAGTKGRKEGEKGRGIFPDSQRSDCYSRSVVSG